MRKILFLRGVPGAGKSTFIKKSGLEPYTLSTDSIRLLFSSPVLTQEGCLSISQKVNKRVFNFLFDILDKRMSEGHFTVIDATNITSKELNKFKRLVEYYRYESYCITFDVDIDTAKKRNLSREPYKVVPDVVIERKYEDLKRSKLPSWIREIEEDSLDKFLSYEKEDFSRYEAIHHIGDIHGCIEPLEEYFKLGIDPNQLYIFLGDFVDRGLDNSRVVKFVLDLMDKPNVLFLEGNHEIHLWKWSIGETSNSEVFNKETAVQLEKDSISKDRVRMFCKSLRQCVYYKYFDKDIFVSHAGISTIPECGITYIPSMQFIKGVGTYKDIPYESFMRTTSSNTYQIHGHRNIENLPIQPVERCFNLEGKIEFGGYLRTVTLNKEGFTVREIKNNKFKENKKKGS